MKKIYTNIYLDRKINFRGTIVEFNSKGESEVSEKVFNEIKEANLPHIFVEQDKVTKIKSSNEKDADETIKVLKEEYLKEIDHLKNVIVGKDKQIEQLTKERDAWKDEATKALSKKTNNNSSLKENEDDILTDLEKMSLEELLELAEGENVDLTNKEDKAVVISDLLSFYKK